MPDFGKALRGLGLARTQEAIRPFSEQLQYLRSRWRVIPNVLPPGEPHSNALGSHYFIHKFYPEDYYHGKVRLSRFSVPDLECLIRLMRQKASVPERSRIVFLDTETTGVQGGTGICPFLIGTGYFTDDGFHMAQYFIRDFDEEPSMLLALGEQLNQFDLMITYNGAAFDIPLLETRFTLARLESPFAGLSQFDMLFAARKLWRNGHGSCRLIALEREMTSFLRGPDIPGAMIPRAYFDYLQQRPAPALSSIFTHNVYDVVSLAALTVHACDRVTLEPAALDDPLDLYSLARVMERSSEWRRSISLYEMALRGGVAEPFRRKALEELAVVYRRAGDYERSHELCEELMRCAEFSMVGYEGAAIYHERVARDFESALRVLEEGLPRTDNKRWKLLLQARWDRLQQKRLEI